MQSNGIFGARNYAKAPSLAAIRNGEAGLVAGTHGPAVQHFQKLLGLSEAQCHGHFDEATMDAMRLYMTVDPALADTVDAPGTVSDKSIAYLEAMMGFIEASGVAG